MAPDEVRRLTAIPGGARTSEETARLVCAGARERSAALRGAGPCPPDTAAASRWRAALHDEVLTWAQDALDAAHVLRDRTRGAARRFVEKVGSRASIKTEARVVGAFVRLLGGTPGAVLKIALGLVGDALRVGKETEPLEVLVARLDEEHERLRAFVRDARDVWLPTIDDAAAPEDAAVVSDALSKLRVPAVPSENELLVGLLAEYGRADGLRVSCAEFWRINGDGKTRCWPLDAELFGYRSADLADDLNALEAAGTRVSPLEIGED